MNMGYLAFQKSVRFNRLYKNLTIPREMGYVEGIQGWSLPRPKIGSIDKHRQ
jgi:hypothetical protein